MNRGRRPPVHYHTLLSCCCVVTSILTHTMALAKSHLVVWCPQTIKQYTWSNNYADVHKAASLLTANVVCTGDYVYVLANLVCFIVHVMSTVLQRVADRASENNLFLQYPIWMKPIFSEWFLQNICMSLIPPLFRFSFQKAAAVMTGGPGLMEDLLSLQKFDFIFYTGGRKGAQRVTQLASKFLTPVALELGGKW